jgi:RZZ complex, subunit zwilch
MSATTNNQAAEKQRKTLLHTDNRISSNTVEKSFVGFQNSRFQLPQIESQLARLAQFHLILEHLMLIQVNLNLEGVYTPATEHLLQRPLVNFDQLLLQTCDKAEIPVINDRIFSIIEK